MVSKHAGVPTEKGDIAISVHITEQVAAKEDVDPLDLPPLHTAVDGDALNALVNHRGKTAELEVTFSYAGHAVTVAGDGTVSVHE